MKYQTTIAQRNILSFASNVANLRNLANQEFLLVTAPCVALEHAKLIEISKTGKTLQVEFPDLPSKQVALYAIYPLDADGCIEQAALVNEKFAEYQAVFEAERQQEMEAQRKTKALEERMFQRWLFERKNKQVKAIAV